MTAPAETVSRQRPFDLDADFPERRVSLPEGLGTGGREATFCLVEDADSTRQVRFKGDPRIWEWAGVYEYLVRRLLKGNPPAAMAHLLQRTVHKAGEAPERLRAVVLGAGNGWVAEELRQVCVGQVVGVEPSAAAVAAADRDHPGVHEELLVLDMRRLSETQRDQLMDFDFNCLVTVDPLAVDEPAPNAFTEAFNLLAPDGWVAVHLAEELAAPDSDSRFARLVYQMMGSGALRVDTRERYRHRFSTNGAPLYHLAVIGRKVRDFDPGEPS